METDQMVSVLDSQFLVGCPPVSEYHRLPSLPYPSRSIRCQKHARSGPCREGVSGRPLEAPGLEET